MLLVNGSAQAAHRVSWELHFGAITEGLCVLHRCDNAGCVRPDHLFLGTPADNVADMMAKNRVQRGERNGLAKLTEQKVGRMRELRHDGVGVREIARRFGVCCATVSFAVRRLNWKHVP